MRYPFASPEQSPPLGGGGQLPQGPLPADALCHLPHPAAAGESGLICPPHLLRGQPLCLRAHGQVKTLYYVDKVFYHYFIGREDQSVQEGVMIRRIDQQLRVNRLMLAQVDLDQVENSGCAGICSTTWKSSPPSPRCCCSAPGTRSTWKRPGPLAGHGGITPPLPAAQPAAVWPGTEHARPGAAGLPWPSIGSARRCLALTESGEKVRACPVGTGPVFSAFPGGGKIPSCGLRLGGRSFIIRTPSAWAVNPMP